MLLFSCHRHHHHRTSVTLTEDNRTLLLKAAYNSDKHYLVQRYLNTKLGYTNGYYDFDDDYSTAIITADDSKVFVQSMPGYVKIKFYKNQHSTAAYEKVKSICAGIKEIIN